MTASRILTLGAGVWMAGGIAGMGADLSADRILEQVSAAYKALDTYQAEGTITSDVDTGGMKVKTETSFSILLKKPDLYLITWTQKNQAMPGMAQSGAVWNAGEKPHLYMGMMNAYSQMTSDEIALGGATGISGGAAFTIPSLFLSVYSVQPDPFDRLKNPTLEPEESVAGDDCHVVTSASSISSKETLWISKSSHLIRKYERSLEPPEGGAQLPEMTDEQLEEAIRGMGQDVTEENKTNMRKMMDQSRSMLKTVKLKGSSTELHATITSPDLAPDAFAFSVPEGTVLKDSLFGSILGGTP